MQLDRYERDGFLIFPSLFSAHEVRLLRSRLPTLSIFSSIVTPIYNALTRDQRPEYKHHRDLSPLAPLPDDCLLDRVVTVAG